MTAFDSPGYGDSRPLFYVRGHGVNLTLLLVSLHVAAAVACCLLLPTFGVDPLKGWVGYNASGVLERARLWQVLTYAFVHLPDKIDTIGASLLGFFIEMYLFWTFGREVERHLGLGGFLKLYGALLLTTPVLFTVCGLISGYNLQFSGSALLSLCTFVAFAMLYPEVQFFLINVPAKWMAAISVIAYTLGQFAYQQWAAMLALWVSLGVTFVGIRATGAAGGFAFLENLQRTLPRRRTPVPTRGNAIVKPRTRPRRAVEAGVGGANAPAGPANAAPSAARDVHESIDPLLDKIAKHGLGSLTASEKATLERARASLLRKDRRG